MPTIKLLNELSPMLMFRKEALNEVTQRIMEICFGLGLTDVHAEYVWSDGAAVPKCCAAVSDSEPCARACCIYGSLTAIYLVEFPPEACSDRERIGAFLSDCAQFCLNKGYTFTYESCQISNAGSIIQLAVSISGTHI